MTRTNTLSTLAAALLATAFVPQATAQNNITTEVWMTGFSSPLYLVSPPGDTERIFVVEQNTRRIEIVKNGVLLPTPFLTVNGVSTNGERGLLGLAFHPDYANNGRFFVNYTNTGGHTRVQEYSVTAPMGGTILDQDVANPAAVQSIFNLNQPQPNHNGGCLQFGPDGLLYIGTGDGGGANDTSNNAQDPLDNLGKMIRLDVDLPSPFIPPSNPFVGMTTTNDPIWAIGLRNPWRYSFDRLTGDLYIGDVGQGAWEEVTFEAAGDPGGNNYGWRCREGAHNFNTAGCTGTYIDPIDEYNHGLGCSITGGYVYRGSAIPSLQGTYFYGDYCSGRVWTFEYDGNTLTNKQERTAELGGPFGGLTSFGEDADGELYIVQQGGVIRKIVQDCGTVNYCVGGLNSAFQTSTMGASGSLSVSANNFSLQAFGATTNQPGLFYYGPTQIQTPFGDGFRCVGGSVSRLNPPVMTDGFFGDATRPVDFTAPPADAGQGQITPGSTWNFQFWYRDPAGMGGSGFNLSDGMSALFCP